MTKLETGKDLLIRSVEGIIDVVATNVPGTPDFRQFLKRQGERCEGGFEGEYFRITNECTEHFINLALPGFSPDLLAAIYHDEEVRIAAVTFFDNFVRESIVPRVRAIDVSGDLFSYWMGLKSSAREFGHLYEEIAKSTDSFGFADATAIVAILALAVQAKTAMDAGDSNTAWVKLIDASYWLGTIKGGKIGFFTGKKHGSWANKTTQAIRNAEKKNAPNRHLKARVKQLVYEKMPLAKWDSYPAAASVLETLLIEECKQMNALKTAPNGDKIAMVTRDTIVDWLGQMSDGEKLRLFNNRHRVGKRR